MVRVLQFGSFKVYIYPETGGRHHEPHCHVYWPDGICSVGLNDMQVLGGIEVPRNVRAFLELHQAELWEAWRRLNGDPR